MLTGKGKPKESPRPPGVRKEEGSQIPTRTKRNPAAHKDSDKDHQSAIYVGEKNIKNITDCARQSPAINKKKISNFWV